MGDWEGSTGLHHVYVHLNPRWIHTHQAFPVIHSRKILLKLFAHIEVHVVVFEGAESLDVDVVPIVDDVLVGLQQGGDFSDGNIYICNKCQKKVEK